jgi:F0F1-type ATP synthase alpha subunit
MDDVAISRVTEFQTKFLQFIDASYSSLRQGLAEKKDMSKEFEDQLKKALVEFKERVWTK